MSVPSFWDCFDGLPLALFRSAFEYISVKTLLGGVKRMASPFFFYICFKKEMHNKIKGPK